MSSIFQRIARKVFLLPAICLLSVIARGQKAPTLHPSSGHSFNGVYTGSNLGRVAFPIGGIGAGMFCLEGTGAISHMSVRNSPDIFNEPVLFAAIAVKGSPSSARVLEGPVPGWKKFGMHDAAKGGVGSDWGLARFRSAEFLARFPFAEITLKDPELPLAVSITGWSPFIPTDADNSSLPVGALEYKFKNTGAAPRDYVFSYNARNFMAITDQFGQPSENNRIKSIPHGFILSQDQGPETPADKGDFAIYTDGGDSTIVDHCWFRGGWFDPLTMAWNHIQQAVIQPVPPADRLAPGASLFVSFTLQPGQEKKIRVLMAWYVPETRQRFSGQPTFNGDLGTAGETTPYYKPWYSRQFHSVEDLANYWKDHYTELRKNSNLFTDAFYKSTLPPEVMEAISANLCILKSPTVIRQTDGRFWGWEGCGDARGSCSGSCTHVWNYAQALPHLFPSLERTLRETEFVDSQDSAGHQNFRAGLPIRPLAHTFYAAADGQLGGIMKVYRDWRIGGDSVWLRKIYPRVRSSLDYCIRTWDPRHTGTVEEPHHNTYDIEFWGPDPLCTSVYLGALEAITKMGAYLGDQVNLYQDLAARGRTFMERQLYNGEYYIQKIKWKGLSANDPQEEAKRSFGGGYSREAMTLLQQEGPKYQYGSGCLSDGVLGAWLARVCGLESPMDTLQIKNHLLSVYRYNFKKDLSGHSNPQRPTFALGNEGGLLLCTWPKGGRLSLPFIYSNEVWTGIEYQVASHLIFMGRVKEGLEIVRTCRQRYDGGVRNPFDEYECGHWYARALSSYALLESLTGVRYDAVEKTLYIHSRVGDFTSFLSTDSGFGNVLYKNGKVSLHTVFGFIPVTRVVVSE